MIRNLSQYKGTKTLIAFNDDDEYVGVLKLLVDIFHGWNSRLDDSSRRDSDLVSQFKYINMFEDCLERTNFREKYKDDYVVIEACEFLADFEESLINFHYINKDGVKTSKVAKSISEITDLKELLYQITT
jgi:hypothetical protein